MWIALTVITAIMLISLGFVVAMYEERHHEDECHFRVVEKNEKFYIQRHVLNIGEDGIRHSSWEYEYYFDENGNNVIYEYEYCSDAIETARYLKTESMKSAKESFKEYIRGNRDDFTIIKYFE